MRQGQLTGGGGEGGDSNGVTTPSTQRKSDSWVTGAVATGDGGGGDGIGGGGFGCGGDGGGGGGEDKPGGVGGCSPHWANVMHSRP